MEILINLIARETNIKNWQIENAIALRTEGGTLPFIARYRKEKTGELDENQLREIFDKFDYLTELEDRKQTILKSIEEQGKLTDELRNQIVNCFNKNQLEDIYLPYKPKKRTKATIAKEKGLEPLAESIKLANSENNLAFDLEKEAANYLNETLGVTNLKEAISGASDIIAEEISEIAVLRQWFRDYILKKGYFKTKIKDDIEAGSTKFEMFRDFEVQVSTIQPHTMLAMRRGETEKIVNLELKFDEDEVFDYFNFKVVQTSNPTLKTFYTSCIKDSFTRLVKHSIIGEARLEKKKEADEESVRIFFENLKQILLASPAGMKNTLGIDPGFRTGCKIAVLDKTGNFQKYETIFPFMSQYNKEDAKNKIKFLISEYNIELIAIGNGTAGRETEAFVSECMNEIEQKPIKVMVSEAGASIYSASPVANEEFPELDLTIRGAISIGRRLQDPLAELVKIDPKSIGVGQYQHDVDQKMLKKNLDDAVISCVNYVGVDLNTASKQLLTYVSGLNETIAKNIVEYRSKNGKFNSRFDLLKVPRFGDKTFELSAGFLRIRDGVNPLDNTAVHPESYELVEKIAKDLNIELSKISLEKEKLSNIEFKKYVSEKFGEPTIKDILKEIEKPGRDPREVFTYAEFKEGVNSVNDLREGMELEGVVTNLTKFGAFVDVGVHQDGLVHISEISNTFVKDPTVALKVNQKVNVKVLSIDEKLKRFSLSIKQAGQAGQASKQTEKKPTPKKEEPVFSLNDLKNKFA